jgi:hypothetical protein
MLIAYGFNDKAADSIDLAGFPPPDHKQYCPLDKAVRQN